MADPERLARLWNELMSDPRYATGSRRFPMSVDEGEAAAIADGVADEFDGGVRAREELAEKQGLHIYCRPGCAACCEVMVMCYEPEALRIADWLDLPDNAAARAMFLEEYPRWKAAAGDAPERLADAFEQQKQAEFDRRHLDHLRRRIPCAFLYDGRCTVYPVRPLGCRNTHALDTNTQCVADPPGGRPPSAVSFIPLDRFLKDAVRGLRATHNALTGRRRHRQESICVAVYNILTKRQKRDTGKK